MGKAAASKAASKSPVSVAVCRSAALWDSDAGWLGLRRKRHPSTAHSIKHQTPFSRKLSAAKDARPRIAGKQPSHLELLQEHEGPRMLGTSRGGQGLFHGSCAVLQQQQKRFDVRSCRRELQCTAIVVVRHVHRDPLREQTCQGEAASYRR